MSINELLDDENISPAARAHIDKVYGLLTQCTKAGIIAGAGYDSDFRERILNDPNFVKNVAISIVGTIVDFQKRKRSQEMNNKTSERNLYRFSMWACIEAKSRGGAAGVLMQNVGNVPTWGVLTDVEVYENGKWVKSKDERIIK